MKKEIGLFEAKTNLSKIAERVNRTGQSVTLTRRGEPYVDLVPHQAAAANRRSQRRVLDELEKLRGELSKSSFARIKADINEGRH
ncbi:MAG: type II toxin-antitoxin system prevent-host-death family antitoxin [Tepidisphaeraceae bacterium]|jgi:prevent-host-death family protein